MKTLIRSGRWIFSFAIVALGAENIVCARVSMEALGPGTHVIPVLPWLPSVPWFGVLFGALWVACGAGLLIERWARPSARAVAVTYTLWMLIQVMPKYIASPRNMGLRTVVLEPLSLACLALLMTGSSGTPKWLTVTCRAVVAVAMIVFGIDHFLGLVFIGSLVPGWIPWHQFWVAFFGVVFIAAGIGIAFGLPKERNWERWSWAALGLMFALWVITLHIPRTLGFYHIPNATTDPDEWSSLFIAIGLWGGSWAVAAKLEPAKADSSQPSAPPDSAQCGR
jgi:uncharacterized membrane protein